MLSALFLTPFLNGKLQAQTYSGNLTLKSQADVDAFNYSEITGDLSVNSFNSGNPITDLTPLSKLTSVAGGLSIGSNTSLKSLAGLDNLAAVGYFDIAGNPSLTSLADFSKLTAVRGDLTIFNNPSLRSLAGLGNVISVFGYFILADNNSLTSLAGLDHLTRSSVIDIHDNNSLTSLAGLDHLATVIGYIEVYGNPKLAACCILTSLASGKTYFPVLLFNNAPGCNKLAEIPAACTAPATVSVSYADGSNQQTTGNTLHPYLLLSNEGSSSLAYKNITVRYWLTAEDFSPLNTSINWAQLGTSLVNARYVPLPQPRSGAYGYIEYTFAAGADSLASMSNSGPILSQVSKADWTNFNQANDYSYAASGDYTKNNHITAYYNGALVWGTEPAPVTRSQNLKAYSASRDNAAGTNSIGTTVQLSNEGNTAVGYQDITVRYWFTADGSQPLLYQLDYAKMGQLGVTSKFVIRPVPLFTADTYLELGFTGADSLYPLSSTGNLLQRIRKSDWSGFDQLNDYSFLSGSSLAENTKMTVYVKGTLVYGLEPAATSMMSFSSIQKTNSAVAAEQPNQATALRITVLGNPVKGNTIEMVISGVQSTRMMVTVTDALGKIVSERQVKQAVARQRISMPVDDAATQLLYIRVRTDKELKTMSVLRVK